ncbi:succinate dehydrogenase assembly factor 3, mitochondrial [Betta splendens]|uniref:Succinate dehydrogenase assembly factor 3 n=1 Tax=Betta splendens TaxID=158456 RepID=A0A6P7NU56_BETSP|nr:succinate dehydrogenase assembly factor 3, mitochondrial [Betta splendens]
MAISSHVFAVRSLYKRILVLHRFLPLDLRALGDQYVRDEFRRHRNASDEETKSFMAEWENYRSTLQHQVLESAGHSSVKFGANLSKEQVRHFQDEQIGQLYELMLESTKPKRQFHIWEDK